MHNKFKGHKKIKKGELHIIDEKLQNAYGGGGSIRRLR
jgi:hypothetical protein